MQTKVQTNDFLIYVDRLRDGKVLNICDKISSAFLDIDETDLHFSPYIDVKIEAYTADDHLVLHYSFTAVVLMPCLICNTNFEVTLSCDGEYHTEPLENIPTGIFDCTEILREAILLQSPAFFECGEGNCPERASLESYLKDSAKPETPGLFPFADL